MLGAPLGKPPKGFWGPPTPDYQGLLRGNKMLIACDDAIGESRVYAKAGGALSIPSQLARANGSVAMGSGQFGHAVDMSFDRNATSLAAEIGWSNFPPLGSASFSDDKWTVALYAQVRDTGVSGKQIWWKMNNVAFDFRFSSSNPRFFVRFPIQNFNFQMGVFGLAKFARGTTIVLTYDSPSLSCYLNGALLGTLTSLADPGLVSPGTFKFGEVLSQQRLIFDGWTYLALVSDHAWGDGEIQLFQRNPYGVLQPGFLSRRVPADVIRLAPDLRRFIFDTDVRASAFRAGSRLCVLDPSLRTRTLPPENRTCAVPLATRKETL